MSFLIGDKNISSENEKIWSLAQLLSVSLVVAVAKQNGIEEECARHLLED